MAISTDLREIYSNYEDNRRFYDTIQLYHPNFNVEVAAGFPSDTSYPGENEYPTEANQVGQSFFLVRDDQPHTFKLSDGSDQDFEAYPFNVIQPQVGQDQQDIGIVFDNVSLGIVGNIEKAAENIAVPIMLTFRVYMDGSDESQITPITLALTEITVDMFTVTCKASRVDLFKRKFPWGANSYYDSKFKGLIA